MLGGSHVRRALGQLERASESFMYSRYIVYMYEFLED